MKANIALAMIETEHAQGDLWAEIYYEKELRQYSRVVRCQRKDQPFWAPAPRQGHAAAGLLNDLK